MNLNKELLDGFVQQLVDLDKRMTDSAGTVVQRKKDALEALSTAETDAINATPPEDPSAPGAFDAYPVRTLEIAARVLEEAKALHDEARQTVDDAVIAYLKAKKSDVGAELTSLRAQREEIVNTVKAMSTLLKIEVDIPKAPKGSGGGTSVTRAKSSSGSHYVKAEDGTITSYANDTFSGLAFYAFKRAGVGDLKAALSANGVTELTKPWETTVTVNSITRTIGHRVVATEG